MLQSMGLQSVGYDLATEQQQTPYLKSTQKVCKVVSYTYTIWAKLISQKTNFSKLSLRKYCQSMLSVSTGKRTTALELLVPDSPY